MDTRKPEKQILKFKRKGLKFNHNLEFHNVIGFISFAIKNDGYSMENILSNLRPDEVITFLINDGFRSTGYPFDKGFIKFQEKKYTNSIYWYHEHYGDIIRIKSNYPDLGEYLYYNSKLFIRKQKIKKILNR